jgi:hypothetical protein
MRDTEIEELRALVRQDRRASKGPFSPELRERLKDFLRRRWQAGESLRELGRQLGLSHHTVQFWRSHWGECKQRGAQLRRVEVISETPLVSNTLTVHGPAGIRIEGLTADDVAELWRKLS